MRHIAKEAGCWVIGAATAMQGADVPDDFPGGKLLFKPEEWINDGDAVVIKPMGAIAAGPLNRQKGVLYAEIDKEAPAGPADRLMSAAIIPGRTFSHFRSPESRTNRPASSTECTLDPCLFGKH